MTMQTGFSQKSKLLGTWQSSDGSEVIFNDDKVTIDGVKYDYRVQGNYLYVDDQFGNPYQYTYAVEGNQMQLNIPAMGTFSFTRKQAVAKSNRQDKATSVPQGSTTANARLYGTFCSYSSSGYSSSSSYSTTRHVSFDGKGHYSYGSESSYSGNGDGYVGGDSGYSGTYKVQGKKVILTEKDGTQYVATIFFVQDSGEITELKYGETVFAKALCE